MEANVDLKWKKSANCGISEIFFFKFKIKFFIMIMDSLGNFYNFQFL